MNINALIDVGIGGPGVILFSETKKTKRKVRKPTRKLLEAQAQYCYVTKWKRAKLFRNGSEYFLVSECKLRYRGLVCVRARARPLICKDICTVNQFMLSVDFQAYLNGDWRRIAQYPLLARARGVRYKKKKVQDRAKGGR